jgi:hypothetical protein
MCDVPSIAVFCSESIECFPGTASKFFLKLLVTIPVAPIIAGIIVHFRFFIIIISSSSSSSSNSSSSSSSNSNTVVIATTAAAAAAATKLTLCNTTD